MADCVAVSITTTPGQRVAQPVVEGYLLVPLGTILDLMMEGGDFVIQHIQGKRGDDALISITLPESQRKATPSGAS